MGTLTSHLPTDNSALPNSGYDPRTGLAATRRKLPHTIQPHQQVFGLRTSFPSEGRDFGSMPKTVTLRGFERRNSHPTVRYHSTRRYISLQFYGISNEIGCCPHMAEAAPFLSGCYRKNQASFPDCGRRLASKWRRRWSYTLDATRVCVQESQNMSASKSHPHHSHPPTVYERRALPFSFRKTLN